MRQIHTFVMELIPFGPFKMDASGARVWRDGVEVKLRPQACHALKTLLQHHGQFVDYPQMIDEAWGGLQVSKHTVAVTVGEVKKVLREYGAWISYRPRVGYRLEIPRSDALVKRGWHFWQHHTREGFEKALCCFEQAAAEDANDFRAYEGLASTHLMLATYGMRPPRAMYSRYLEAHRRAVELGGWTAELRADRAHGLHVFEHKLKQAEQELQLACQQKPGLSAIVVRLAILYATTGRGQQALELLAASAGCDPLSPFLASNEIVVHVWNRDFADAVACGQRALELHPYHQLMHFFYAMALECMGSKEDALAEYRRASLLAPDLRWLRAMEAACLAALGRRPEAMAILEDLQQLRQNDYLDAYHFATLFTALGRPDDAFLELDRAHAENSCMLHVLDVDPKLDALRHDPRFEVVREKVFGASLQAVA